MNNHGIILTLNLELFSVESKDISVYVQSEMRPFLLTKYNKNKLFVAISALCGELLEAASIDLYQELYRPFGRSNFTGDAVGYRPYRHALEGFMALGYLQFIEGYCPASPNDPNPPRASRLRATDKFIELAATFGIIPAKWRDHYKARPWNGSVDEPVQVKSASVYVKKGSTHWQMTKKKGEKLLFNPAAPDVAGIIRQVEEINAFLAKQDIQPAHRFRGLRRIFANGDRPGFAWKSAGRLYSVKGGYQQMNRAERRKFVLNGETNVEVDVRGSHLTIYHALRKHPLDWTAGRNVDPYNVPGIDRDIVKRFVTITLGKGKLPHAWPKETKADYREDDATLGQDLQNDHPIAKVKAAVVEHLPLLADIEHSPWGWADFQYLESQAVADAVHALAHVHGVPALPVHDSLIVPVSKQKLATQVLSDAFYKYVGVRPGVSTKL